MYISFFAFLSHLAHGEKGRETDGPCQRTNFFLQRWFQKKENGGGKTQILNKILGLLSQTVTVNYGYG